MSRKEKLIKRLLARPKDFSWDELVSLLVALGFEEIATGKTGGSRRRFIHSNGVTLALHKPHPQNILKRYQIEQVIELLQGEELL
ncbi:type II toxin-antitoxin system HicA family toxin [Synechocystis sp. LKSZ1]|uniref:type II toxin-antitoxin system HicA family toxin n=1 Tax=Synechocystis sp. LKSZ1 TaxID=3144951 RepID=UPI00336BC13E